MYKTEKDVEWDISMQPKGEADLDRMAQWLQSLFKFKNFDNQMGFSLE